MDTIASALNPPAKVSSESKASIADEPEKDERVLVFEERSIVNVPDDDREESRREARIRTRVHDVLNKSVWFSKKQNSDACGGTLCLSLPWSVSRRRCCLVYGHRRTKW